MNKYSPNCYYGDKETRFLLGQTGVKNVLFIGINPSIADNWNADMTIKKIIKFAELNGYDGWIIANIYPQRTTNPKYLHNNKDLDLVNKNIEAIRSLVKSGSIAGVVACWGNLINHRKFFKGLLQDIIYETGLDNIPWFCIDLTKEDIPRHPSRIGYKDFISFDYKNIK